MIQLRHQHALPGIGRPAVGVADRRPVGAVQPRPGVVADDAGPLRQPAHVPVRDDPGRVARDLPQPAQRLGLALQAADVVEVFERTERRGRLQGEAARGEAERRPLAGREHAGEPGAQMRPHALAIAQHGLVDAGAEGRHARQARLARETDAHGQAYRAVDGGLGLPADEVDDQGAHVVTGRIARARPAGSDLDRPARPDDLAGRGQARRRVGLHDAVFCRLAVAGSGGAAQLGPALAVDAELRLLRLGQACDLNQRQARRPCGSSSR